MYQTPTIRRVNVNRVHQSKLLHLGMEINQALIESLVNIGVSMSAMTVNMARKFTIMHLVTGNELLIFQLGLGESFVKWCLWWSTHTITYLLLCLDFLMKIQAIVDVEKGSYRCVMD